MARVPKQQDSEFHHAPHDLSTVLNLAAMIAAQLGGYDAASVVSSMVDVRLSTSASADQMDRALDRLMLDRRLGAQVRERWESVASAWERVVASSAKADAAP